jgi:glycosyltransferase involved in cell wall biosynthesis
VTAQPRLSIFLLIRSLNVGGSERQLVHLALGLQRRGHRVTVGVFYSGGLLELELEKAGVPVVDLAKHGRWDLPGFLVRARRAIISARPDVLYSFLGSANLIAAAVRLTARVPQLVWSIRSSDVDLSKYGRLERTSFALECRLSSAADLIISNSNAGLESAAANGFRRDKIAVVPNGIDTGRFRPDRALRAEQRRRWGLLENQLAVGVLARLDPMKGHDVFLHAAANMAQDRPELRFLCIGEGSEETRLKALAAELGVADRMLFTGLSTDPAAALNALDIYCSPSIFGEGFSNSIAEAMACGLPCVVTDVGDSARIVGDTGRVVPKSDPEALAAAVMDEIGKLGAHRSATARARIVERFSVDAMIDRTLTLLIKADDHLSP